MSSKHASLAEFVTAAMAEKNLSYRKVAERSGGQISHSTIADIANGQRFDIRRDTMIALANGLGVPVEDIFRAARGIGTATGNQFEFYAERFDAHGLSDDEWNFIERYFAETVERFKVTKAQQEQFGDMIAAKLGPDGELDQLGHEGLGIPPKPLAPVVARIEPGKPTTITPEQESEIETRLKRKRA